MIPDVSFPVADAVAQGSGKPSFALAYDSKSRGVASAGMQIT